MSVDLADLHEVGVLIGCALRPKQRPGADSDYRAALVRYRSEAPFRAATDAILDGLGLVVHGASDLGLVVSARRTSVFAFRLSTDLPNVANDANRKLVAGLALLGIAAYAFPQPADLDDATRVRRVRVGEIEAFLRDVCTALRRQAERDAEFVDVADGGVDAAWQVYERMPPTYTPDKGRGSGRRSPKCTTYWIATVLDLLVEQGMARPDPGYGTDTYQLLERFRLHVREFADDEAFERLAELRRAHPGRQVSVPASSGPAVHVPPQDEVVDGAAVPETAVDVPPGPAVDVAAADVAAVDVAAVDVPLGPAVDVPPPEAAVDGAAADEAVDR